MLRIRISASSSSLTLLPCIACSNPTTVSVTKLSTSTIALIRSSDDLRHSAHPKTAAPAEASNLASPCASYVGPLTHAYECCRPRSCTARNTATRPKAGEIRGIRSAYRPAERMVVHDWSGIEEGVRVGRDVIISHFCCAPRAQRANLSFLWA